MSEPHTPISPAVYDQVTKPYESKSGVKEPKPVLFNSGTVTKLKNYQVKLSNRKIKTT